MTEHPDKLDTGFIEYILSAYRASTKEHSGSGAQREEKKSENAQWHEPGLNHFISFIDEMPGGFFIYRAGGTEEIIYANRALLRIFNCHTMERRQDEKKTGTTKFTGRFFVRQRIVLSGNRGTITQS